MNIPLFKVYMSPRDKLMPELERVLYSGYISEGEEVRQFEEKFGRFIGQKNVLSFYSGTAALHTALFLAGVKPGDEVITTPMTAEPTNLAILYAGANPVWTDVCRFSGNMDAGAIAYKITERTKAIMVVHYGGIPAQMDLIRAIGDCYHIPVIEDAAHALGAEYGGEKIGGHSDYVMFSFQAIKHLTTVDGGALVVKKARDLRRGREFRWFGIDRRVKRDVVDIWRVGYKYHMNNVTAVIGLVQLDHIQDVIEQHINNGIYFDGVLEHIPGLYPCRGDHHARPSYWFYTVLADRRDDLMTKLRERGIGCGLVHRRNDLHSVFAGSHKELPNLDWFWEHMLHIPCGWWVSEEERSYIAKTIRSGW